MGDLPEHLFQLVHLLGGIFTGVLVIQESPCIGQWTSIDLERANRDFVGFEISTEEDFSSCMHLLNVFVEPHSYLKVDDVHNLKIS